MHLGMRFLPERGVLWGQTLQKYLWGHSLKWMVGWRIWMQTFNLEKMLHALFLQQWFCNKSLCSDYVCLWQRMLHQPAWAIAAWQRNDWRHNCLLQNHCVLPPPGEDGDTSEYPSAVVGFLAWLFSLDMYSLSRSQQPEEINYMYF